MSQIPSNKFSPEYWGGHNILDEAMFQAATPTRNLWLEYGNLRRTRTWLLQNLGQVAAGNSTEIRYNSGNEFNPDLADGSLVVVDREGLLRQTHSNDPKRPGNLTPDKQGPPIRRPYSEYWLKNQNGENGPSDIGIESAVSNDARARYTRQLAWGVVTTENGAKAIQTFSFNIVRLQSDGTIQTPLMSRKNSALHGPAIPMPVKLGDVQVSPRLTHQGTTTDMMSCVRSIDVVYPMASSRQPSTAGYKRILGQLASLVPRPRPA